MKHHGWTIVPLGGLANRMRVVMSVLEIAPKVTVPLRIVWQSTSECKALFHELFEPFNQPNVCFEDGGNWYFKMSTKRNLWFPHLLRKPKYSIQLEDFNPKDSNILDIIKKYPSGFMSTCYPLTDYDASLTSHFFIPNAELMQQIDTYTELFQNHILGVHIRRTDNKMSILHSPVSGFYEHIEKYLGTFPDAKIFLCSDDEEVKKQFIEAYGNRLLTRNTDLRRNVLKGIQDAVIDLWCLSRTNLVLGSYYSSFSETATELGGQSLEIINVTA